MDSSNSVYRESVMDVDMRHMHALFLIDDLDFGVLVLCTHTLIKLLDIRNKLGNHLFKILKRPFFQSLCKDGMVGICAGLAHNLDGFIHGKCFFLN